MSVDERERLVADYLQPLTEVEPVLRPTTVKAHRRRRGRLVMALGLTGLLVAAVAAIAVRHPAPTPRPAVRPLTPDRVIVTTDGVSVKPWGHTEFRPIAGSTIIGFDFSPDGAWLAFIRLTPANRCSLELMSLANTGIRSLGACNATVRGLLSGGEAGSVVYGGTRFTVKDPGFWGPTWSPDSERVAWMCRTGDPPSRGRLCITDRRGATATVALPDGFSPAWAPDGSAIAYLVDPEVPKHNGYPSDLEAWLMAPDGTHRRRASPRGQDCCVGAHPYLAWSRDARKLLVLGTRAQVIDVATRRSAFQRVEDQG